MVSKDRLVSHFHEQAMHKPDLEYARKEAFYEKPLILADRDMVETNSDAILENADKEDVSLLVVGDPFGCAGPTFLPT